jgi:hypothetical protein
MSCARARGLLAAAAATATDDACAYHAPRLLVIRDRRIGLALFLLRVGAVIFILFEIIDKQLYFALSDVSVSVRLSVRAPPPELRWGFDADGRTPAGVAGQAPYCAGATAPQAPGNSSALAAAYAAAEGGARYAFRGGAAFPRYPCAFLDAAGAAPLAESDRAFVMTESRTTAQWLLARDGGNCTAVTQPGCEWRPAANESDPAVTALRYVPDVEYFTLFIDHSMLAPQASIARTVREMGGEMRDAKGNRFDPCSVYAADGLACPQTEPLRDGSGGSRPGVVVGVAGLPDVIPLKAIMEAAGVATLDAVAGSDNAAAQTSSFRQQGLLLILDISYSNFKNGRPAPGAKPGDPIFGGTGSFSQDVVRYTYRAFAVPNTQFQQQAATQPFGIETARELERLYGVRVLVTTSGRIGFFSWPTAILNAVVSLSIFGLASTLINFAVFRLCPLRNLFTALRETQTVRIGALEAAARAAPGDYASLLAAARARGSGGAAGADADEGDAAGGDARAAALDGRARALIRAARAHSVVVPNPAASAGAPKAAWGP